MPSSGMMVRTETRAISVAISPASPKLRMRSEFEKVSATKERPAVAWVSTQAGPTI